jgi:hypothetical protein
MKGQRTTPVISAERRAMSDEQRARGLAELAERIVDPGWLDRETLAHIEQLTDDDQ